jgi:hypothetical protein
VAALGRRPWWPMDDRPYRITVGGRKLYSGGGQASEVIKMRQVTLKRMAAGIGALALAAFVVPATADAGQPIERDFYATYSGQYQDEPTHECGPGEQANLVLGEGVGRFIGRFDLRIEACVTPTSELTGTVTGGAYYVAANGDQLDFGFAGDYVVNLAEGTIDATLPATSVSGTGRFANVELGDGQGVAVDTNPIGSDVSYGYVSGPLVFDASDRAPSH